MNKLLFSALIAALFLAGCNKAKTASAGGGATVSGDPVQAKLQELAGGVAANCGVLASQADADLTSASKCAMDAATAKRAFYVEYQLPGMNVAVAGNSQGKLYSVQSQAGGAGLTSADCPAELRVAPSGRVTCYAPGTFPMGGDSHGGMPDMGMKGGALPAGHPDPHAAKPAAKP
jgi:hypothetical protein